MAEKKALTLAARLKKAKVKRIVWEPDPSVLLCPNIPKPMHGVAPRVVLGAKWWNETRQEAYRSTNYHCLACGVHKRQARYRKWLEAHELYNVDYKKGIMHYERAVPLCYMCHNYIHDGRMITLLEKGKMTHQKYTAIIQHGDRVLAEAGLSRESKNNRDGAITEMIINGEIQEWSKWRLAIGRKRFPPKFKSEYALRKAFK